MDNIRLRESITIHFVIDNETDEVMVGNDFKIEEDPKYDPGKAYIKYRGGSGYYHHQYKYDI